MPLWNRSPNLTRVRRPKKHLITFLQHGEMMISQCPVVAGSAGNAGTT